MLPALLTDSVTADLDRALHYALLWGLEGVALRAVGGAGDRVPHVNEARLRRRLEEAEMPVVAVDPGLFEGGTSARAAWMNDLAALPETLGFCRRVGSPLVVVGALAGEEAGAWDVQAAGAALRQAAEAAATVGLALAVRNEAGTACATGEALASVLAAAGAGPSFPPLGAAWSPTAALEAGGDPAAGLGVLLDAGVPVHLVTVRDGARADDGWRDTTPGEGTVGWAGQFRALGAAGFRGPLVLEVRERPAASAGLKAASALLALARAARRDART